MAHLGQKILICVEYTGFGADQVKKEAHSVETPLKHGSRGEIFRRFVERRLYLHLSLWRNCRIPLMGIGDEAGEKGNGENPSGENPSGEIPLLLSYPSSSPTQVRHLPQKLLRTVNIDTETTGTNTNYDEVQLYQER